MAAKIATLANIFKPGAPTADQRLFRGRRNQLSRLITVTGAPGQHAIIFGERGVGKTSLSYMARDAFIVQAPDVTISVRLACTVDDNFASLWRKLPGRLRLEVEKAKMQGRSRAAHEALDDVLLDRIEDIFLDDPTPESVGTVLTLIADRVRLLVIVDEFDRMNVLGEGATFADLIKQISDDIVPCTLILVGVADNVSDLIAGHASIDRCLVPVAMPRMTQVELHEVVDEGFHAFSERSCTELVISDHAVSAIAGLSQGFPYYTHLLASSVGREAILDDRDSIEFPHVFDALLLAKDEAEPSIREAYYNATLAARSDAKFEETLIACSLVIPDRMGYFAASDVCAPLSSILGVPRKNSDFNSHLKRFSSEPPMVLDVKATRRTPRYRFANPLMKPYALLCGLSNGILQRDVLEQIQ